MRTYEELVGAEGRRVFYRAERFDARDLFPRRTPAVVVDGERFELENISMTGLAVRAKPCADQRTRGRSRAIRTHPYAHGRYLGSNICAAELGRA